MNKREANIILISVTLCWGIQYIFLKNVPSDVSTFAFLTLTNLIGAVILAAVFAKQLRGFTRKIILKSLVLAALSCALNACLVVGSETIEASTASFAGAMYVVFVPIIMLFLKNKLTLSNILGILIAVSGLIYVTGATSFGELDIGIVYILVADVFFAIYIIVLDKMSKNTNPVLLAIGQMVFCAIISYIIWSISQPKTFLELNYSSEFLMSVFAIAFFSRAYSTVMQIYAQRYVSAINAALIFSGEAVFALLASLFIPAAIGGNVETLTSNKVIGCLLVVSAVIVSDTDLVGIIMSRLKRKESEKTNA